MNRLKRMLLPDLYYILVLLTKDSLQAYQARSMIIASCIQVYE